MRFFGTREVAKLLGVTPGAILQAVWHGRLDPPQKGPGGAFLWTVSDINRASWLLLRRGFDAVPPEPLGMDLRSPVIC
jgi:hypothetical protein